MTHPSAVDAWAVQSSPMPKGVEHQWQYQTIQEQAAVQSSPMPKGVEHAQEKGAAVLIAKQSNHHRCRKALSTFLWTL